jgi:hypothetical protein
VPSLAYVLLAQSSYAIGIVTSSILVFLVYNLFLSSKFIYKPVLKQIAIGLSLLLIHSYLSIITNTKFDYLRFFISIFFLASLLIGAISFSNLFVSFSNDEIDFSIIAIFFVFLCSGIFWGSSLLPAFGNYSTFILPIFPFAEPSHFALYFAPFYCYMVAREKRQMVKYLLYLVPLIFLFFFSNLTLLIVFLFVFLVTTNNLYPFLVIGALVLVYTLFSFDLSYYTQRISLDQDNLSSLIWIQGWEEAIINFIDSNFIGVGFQQFGVIPPRGEFSKIVNLIYLSDFNRYDGGTLAAKMFGEFGVFGLIVIFIMLRQVIRSGLILYKNCRNNTLDSVSLFANCSIFSFSFELFIRTTSYFSTSFFLFISSLLILQHIKYAGSGER